MDTKSVTHIFDHRMHKKTMAQGVDVVNLQEMFRYIPISRAVTLTDRRRPNRWDIYLHCSLLDNQSAQTFPKIARILSRKKKPIEEKANSPNYLLHQFVIILTAKNAWYTQEECSRFVCYAIQLCVWTPWFCQYAFWAQWQFYDLPSAKMSS